MKKGMAQVTVENEGWERAALLIIVPTAAGNLSYLCYAVGEDKGHIFFDLTNSNRVELHGKDPHFIMHCPTKGYTFELSGECRELRSTSKLVVH